MNIEILRENYQSGKVFLVDKPLEWTSFDVVNKLRTRLRYDLGLKKIKVGHAGTLDPLASGLLIVCVGKETKKIDAYQGMPKEYVAEVTLGATTPSFDAETEIDQRYPYEHIGLEQLESALEGMTGSIEQTVPIYSAVKIDGVRSYKLARSGEEVPKKSRVIEIQNIDNLAFDPPVVKLRITCSKGTYIRAVAHDLGQALGSGAYLSGLRRTKIGDYDVMRAQTVDAWIQALKEEITAASE